MKKHNVQLYIKLLVYHVAVDCEYDSNLLYSKCLNMAQYRKQIT